MSQAAAIRDIIEYMYIYKKPLLSSANMDVKIVVCFHSLGVGHDSEGNVCPNYVNIMSTVLQGGPGSVEWSSCSMAKIQGFLV